MGTTSLLKNFETGRHLVRYDSMMTLRSELSDYIRRIRNPEINHDHKLRWLMDTVEPTAYKKDYGTFCVFTLDFLLEDHQFAEYLFLFGSTR